MNKDGEAPKGGERPLDDLLSMRGKPFADWKEEREYLRRKWGEQGKQVSPNPDAGEPAKQEQDRVPPNEDSA